MFEIRSARLNSRLVITDNDCVGWRLVSVGFVSVLTAALLTAPGAGAGEPEPAEWREPTATVTEDPEVLAEDVGRSEKSDVVVVTAAADGLDVATVPVTGQAAAEQAIAAAQEQPGVVAVGMDQPVHAFGSDPLRPEQWALDMVHADTAWTTSRGAGVVVAVIDSGVDGSHPDLIGALVPGFNARTDRGDTSSPDTDPDGHGTHVAGTIAARQGNGIGIAGLAPDSQIMPVKALDAQGEGYMSDVVEGMTWAVDHGAGVINLSLGGPDADFASSAVTYARSKGVTVVAAAGNDGTTTPMYPAAVPGVLGVAAVDANGNAASYSNRGSWVDIAAPGSRIISTVPAPENYASYSGTSMATPHVSAVAALVRAAAPGSDPVSVITSTATDMGLGPDYGAGVVDAAAAVAAARPGPTPTPTPTSVPVQTQSVKVPSSVRVGRTKALPRRTAQGVSISGWRTSTYSRCGLVRRAGKARVLGKRRGTCKLRVTAPASGNYAALNTRLTLRVT